jgi:hypothetical protein
MTRSRVAAGRRSRRCQTTRTPLLLNGLGIALLLGACEQPVRPAPGPTPLDVAAAQLNVPAATIHELAATAARVVVPSATVAAPDPSSPEAERLRQIMHRLEENQPGTGAPVR